MKLFIVILLSSILTGVLVFPIFASVKQGFSASSNGFIALNSSGFTVLFGVVIGAGIGLIVGVVAGIYSVIIGQITANKLPIWSIVAFSIASGSLWFLFFFSLLSQTHPTYKSVIQYEWLGLSIDLASGFLLAFVPLFAVKLKLDL